MFDRNVLELEAEVGTVWCCQSTNIQIGLMLPEHGKPVCIHYISGTNFTSSLRRSLGVN